LSFRTRLTVASLTPTSSATSANVVIGAKIYDENQQTNRRTRAAGCRRADVSRQFVVFRTLVHVPALCRAEPQADADPPADAASRAKESPLCDAAPVAEL